MRTISTGLANHIEQQVTTLATCIKIDREDGQSYYYTDHDNDIELLGNTYVANIGYSRTAIDSSSNMNVDNVDLTGFIDSAGITDIDIRNGVFDNASIILYLVNWANISDGYTILKKGTIGNINITSNLQYIAEIRGLTQRLVKIIGKKYQSECRADLGDLECKIPIQPPIIERSTEYLIGDWVRVVTGTGNTQSRFENRIYECIVSGNTAAIQPDYVITIGEVNIDGTAQFRVHDSWTKHGEVISVIDRTTFRVVNIPAIRTYNIRTRPTSDEVLPFYKELGVLAPSTLQLKWFNLGALYWETGANVGVTKEIKSWNSSLGQIELYLPTNYDIQVGDIFWYYPGCDKRRITCIDKFRMINSRYFENGNIYNFRGEPDLPGRDLLFRYPDRSR